MAQGKKSIVIYSDWMELFESLNDDEAGKLIKHFFRYVNDLNPTPPDRITELSFIPIKQSLKRDLQKWSETIEKRSKAGKASAEKRNKDKQVSTNSTHVESVEQTSTNPTDSVNVSVSVNVSDNVNDIRDKKNVKKEIPEFSEFLTYAKTLPPYKSELDFALQAKYNSWIENKWKDGHGAPIKNWKTKLQNTITFLKPVFSQQSKPEEKRVDLKKHEWKGPVQ